MSAPRPMLAATYDEVVVQRHLDKCGYLYLQPKIDGMRMLVGLDGKPYSRSGKLHRNVAINRCMAVFGKHLGPLDGEMHSGHTMTAESFRGSMSHIRSRDGSGVFTYWVFDTYDGAPQKDRFESLYGRDIQGHYRSAPNEEVPFDMLLKIVPLHEVHSIAEIDRLYATYLERGFEGICLRRPDKKYVPKRSTLLQGNLIKRKNFEDGEAVIVDFEPWYHNGNDPVDDAFGLSKRSSHQENLVPLERMGAFLCETLDEKRTPFKIGVMRGVTLEDRDWMWANREKLRGLVITYSHQGYGGGYDKPRTPVFLRFRPYEDLPRKWQ